MSDFLVFVSFQLRCFHCLITLFSLRTHRMCVCACLCLDMMCRTFNKLSERLLMFNKILSSHHDALVHSHCVFPLDCIINYSILQVKITQRSARIHFGFRAFSLLLIEIKSIRMHIDLLRESFERYRNTELSNLSRDFI